MSTSRRASAAGSGQVLALLLASVLTGCSADPARPVPGDANPGLRATASAGPSTGPLDPAPRDYRVVDGEGFTIRAPAAFQASTTRSRNGQPALSLRRPSSIAELPSSVVVLRDPKATSDVVEQSYALEVSKRTLAGATDVQRIDVVWPGTTRAVLVRWTEQVPIGSGRTVPTRYTQLNAQLGGSSIMVVVALSPVADADTSVVENVLRTFRPDAAGA